MVPSHPRTALALGALGSAAALTGPRGAVVAMVTLLFWAAGGWWRAGGPRPGLRILPLLAAFALLLVVAPWAPRAAATVLLQGFAVSLGVVLAVAAAGAVPLVAELAALGLPRTAVTFLLVLARHASGMREEALRAYRALALRGGWDRWGNRGRAIGILLTALLGEGFSRADRVAAALEVRGFAGRLPPPPRYRLASQWPQLALLLPLAAALAWEARAWSL